MVLTAVSLDADGNGRISGLARRPLEVMARLERSEGVANPHLEGGTVREGIRGLPWERFTAAFGQAPAR